MRKYIFPIIALVLIVSCNDYKYPENPELSERNGAPVDSSASYIRGKFEFKGVNRVLAWNEAVLDQLNESYRMTSEPILYNYYTGRDVFRIVLVEKGKLPLILSVNKTNKRSWVVYKQIFEIEDIAEDCGFRIVKDYVNRTRDLTDEELEKFDTLWKASGFYDLANQEMDKSFDNYCVIEAHEKGKYWYVFRPLNDTSLQELTAYVRSLVRV